MQAALQKTVQVQPGDKIEVGDEITVCAGCGTDLVA